MKTFNELTYKRVEEEEIKERLQKSIDELKNAKSCEEVMQIYYDWQEFEDEFTTMMSLAHIRNTMNTADEFYENEVKVNGAAMARLTDLFKEFDSVILNSEFKEELKQHWGELLFKELEIQQSLQSDKLIDNKIAQQDLTNEYAKTIASSSCEFKGETCNFYGLLKHMLNQNADHRYEAMEAWSKMYENISGKLDDIYDKLCALRKESAEILGYEDYITMTYLARGRYDYLPKDIDEFRENVAKYIVPVVHDLFRQQEERLGLDELRWCDETLQYPEGNPTPFGSTKEKVEAAQKMYQELSPETAEFFNFMVEHELYDLETRNNKRQGGYATSLPKYKAPFIFSNFNGTAADVDVLTHEAGHCFMGYMSVRSQKISNYRWSTSEINEIHSMAMEFFTHPWMHLFFKDDADRYRKAHLIESFSSICYLVAVDEFQHRVFREDLNASGRRKAWKEIEKKYMPWRSYGDIEFLNEGGFWMQKQHIFLYPFYYVDYALAQLCALQYYIRMQDNREETWQDYLRLCKAAGSKPYFELLELANLNNPFKEETIKEVVSGLKPYLEI